MFRSKYSNSFFIASLTLLVLGAGLFVFFNGKAVNASSLPDFKITNVRFEPEEPVNGQKITPQLTIKNVGATKEGGPDVLINNLGQLEGSDSNDTVGGLQTGTFQSGEEYEIEMTEFSIDKVGDTKMTFTTDLLDDIEESNEDNNTYTASVDVREKLPEPKNVIVESEVSSLDSWDGALIIHWGDSVEIDKEETKLSIYRSSTKGELGQLLTSTYLDDFSGYHDREVKFYEPYYYTLVYKTDNGRVSLGENQYKGVLKKPDLQIDDLTFPGNVEPGDTDDLKIEVGNKGNGAVNMSTVGLKIKKEGEVVEDEITSGRSLVPEGYDEESAKADVNFVDSYVHSVPLTFGSLGKKEISVEIDPDNTVPELKESNNSNNFTTSVGVDHKNPDLKVHEPTVVENNYVKVNISNLGEKDAEEFYTTVEVDGAEKCRDFSDELPLPQTDPLSFYQHSFKCNYNLSPGQHQLRIEVDAGKSVGESDESNNVVEKTFTVDQQEKIITLRSPKADDKWQVGKEYSIEWESRGVGQVNLNLSIPHITKWIAKEVPADNGAYTWTVPETIEVGGSKISLAGVKKDNPEIWIESSANSRINDKSEFIAVGTDQPNYERKLLRLKSSHKVYEVIDGERHWIRNPEEFNKKGYRSSEVQTTPLSQLNEYPPLRLIRQKGKKKIYIVGEKNNKRHIPNPDTFYSYGFEPGEITEVGKATIEAIPETKLIRWQKSSKVYRIENGKKRLVSSIEAFNSQGYEWGRVANVNKTELESYPKGEPIN